MWGGPNPSTDPANPRWSLRSGQSSSPESIPSISAPSPALLPENGLTRNTPMSGNGTSSGTPLRDRVDAPQFDDRDRWWPRYTALGTQKPRCRPRDWRRACVNDHGPPSIHHQSAVGAIVRKVLRSLRSLRTVPRWGAVRHPRLQGVTPMRTDRSSPSASPLPSSAPAPRSEQLCPSPPSRTR